MSNYLILILGYLLIFFSIIFTYFRIKKIELTTEDRFHFLVLREKFVFVENKFLNLLKNFLKEINFLWQALIEKILRRIKIEALKIESWASKKLEKMKKYDKII